MANQYTAGAYAGVKPIQEDFGDDALKAYEITMKNNAQKIAIRKQKAAEAKAAQDRLDAAFKDMDKYAAMALNLQPKDFDKDFTAGYLDTTRNNVIKNMRILANPNASSMDIMMARTNIRTASDNTINYINDRKSIEGLLSDLNNLDTEDGWDSVLSADAGLAINRALFSGWEEGAKKNEDGSISAGRYLTQKTTGNGVIITLKCADLLGEDISGTYSEIAAKLKGKMFKTVNLQKELWDYAGKGLQPRVREFYKNTPGGLIEVIKQNKWDEIDRMIGDDFDARFPDADSFKNLPVQIRKAIKQGGSAGYNSREDVKRAYILAGRNKVKDETNLQLMNDPAFVDEYKRYRMSKGQDSATAPVEFLRQVQAFATGDESAINYFIGKPIGLNVPNVRGEVKLEDVNVDGSNLTMTVGGAYATDKDKNIIEPITQDYTFDLNNPDDMKVVINALAPAYNNGKKEKQQVDISKIHDYYNPKTGVLSKGNELMDDISDKLNKLSLKRENNPSTKELKDAFDDIDKNLKDLGYDMNIDGSFTWFGFGRSGKAQVKITDSNGREVFNADTASGSEIVDKLKRFVSGLRAYRKPGEANPGWILNSSVDGNVPVNVAVSSSTTRKGSSVPNLNNF